MNPKDLIEKWIKILLTKINYAHLINAHPVVAMFVTSLISVGLTFLAIKTTGTPTFSYPNLGFETRRTKLSGRVLTFRNIDELTSVYPDPGKKFFRQIYASHYRTIRSNSFSDVNETTIQSGCESPALLFNEIDHYSQIVLESPSLDDLFSVRTQMELCNFDISLMKMLTPIAQFQIYERMFSLSSYILCLIQEIDCDSINETNIIQAKQAILECSSHRKAIYDCRHNASMNIACTEIPEHCTSQLIFQLLHFLLSNKLLTNNNPVYNLLVIPSPNVKLADHFSESDTKYIDAFKAVTELADTRLHSIKLVGQHNGAESQLVETNFLDDTIDVLVGLSVLLVILWIYSDSVCFSISVLLTLAYSVGLAYFVYRLVFRIDFFPFINLLVIVLLVATAGDDTFVMHHIFDLYRKHGQIGLNEVDISEAITNAALSMFIASVTTAAAFFSNLISDILIIKCFAVFAGTVMLMNYLIVATFLPACIVAIDRHVEPILSDSILSTIFGKWKQVRKSASLVLNQVLVDGFVPMLIIQLKFLLITLGFAAFIGSFFVVFYWPKLSLPSNSLLQENKKDNPIEWYEKNMVHYFDFSAEENRKAIQISLVWGFDPVDNGPLLDPWDIGEASLTHDFRLDIETFKALNLLCELLDLDNVTSLITHHSCFPQQFFKWSIEQQCRDNRTICCNYTNGQFHPKDLHYCLAEASQNSSLIEYGHPIFDSESFYTNQMFDAVGVILYFDTSFNQTSSYDDLKVFHNSIDSALSEAMDVMGSSKQYVERGWFVTTFFDIMALYDLQTSLLTKTPYSVLISVAITLFVVVWSTKTVLLSILCMTTICAIIMVTTASLILLQFQLNIVESTIIVLTVGLSMVSPIHFAVGYKLAPNATRNEKVFATLAYVAVPVAFSNLTTCLAGCAMLRVSSASYYNTGLFMILISIVGWFYACLFFLSLLSWCGPQDFVEGRCEVVQCYNEMTHCREQTAAPIVSRTSSSVATSSL